MSDDVLVRVENVSKRFCRSLKRSLWYGLQDLGSEIGGRRHGGGSGLPQRSADVQLRADEFWAVKDVSFELRRGECLGLIGRNGAGKTTLLRMLNGLIKPDTGRIEMKGQIGALIALGAGFNPLLTGRENIYINASVLGLTKEGINRRIGEIIEFAEIGDFIDSPVQSYSSGMQVRLGFAVAAITRPDVFILDEVLAVGDAVFRAKCYNHLSTILPETATIFVSHSREQVFQVCSSALLMDKGRCIASGAVEEAFSSYKETPTIEATNKEPILQQPIASIIVSGLERPCNYGDTLGINIVLNASEAIRSMSLKIAIFDSTFRRIVNCYSKDNMKHCLAMPGENRFTANIGPLYLEEGSYIISLLIIDPNTNKHLAWFDKSLHLAVAGKPASSDTPITSFPVEITRNTDRR